MSRAYETSKMAENIMKSFDVRRDTDAARHTAVTKGKNDTHAVMAKFDADHSAMSKALKSNLAKDQRERKAAVNTTMHNNAAISAQCKNTWATLSETMQKKHTSPASVSPKPATKK